MTLSSFASSDARIRHTVCVERDTGGSYLRSSGVVRRTPLSCAISRIDHIAVTAADLGAASVFYTRVLEAEVVRDFRIDGKVIATQFRIGGAMLNIHQAGHGQALVAMRPTPGAVDLCFRWDAPIDTALAHLASVGVEIIEGPVERFASDGRAGLSVYFRDMDGGLLELLSTTKTTGD